MAEVDVLEALRDVEDPELPISIVDMGLFVAAHIRESTIDVDITLTAMGCPGVDMLIEDIERRMLREQGVDRVNVRIVWDPIWTKDRLTEDGRAQMREWGIAV